VQESDAPPTMRHRATALAQGVRFVRKKTWSVAVVALWKPAAVIWLWLTARSKPLQDSVSTSRAKAKPIALPRDAASLILLRPEGREFHVLMGRRSLSARFMPGFYVFPGGRAAAADKTQLCVEPQKRPKDRHSLMRAAIRETYEETGLLLGHPARHAGGRPALISALESAYLAQGLCPAIDALRYIGRAITPRQSPIRFNTRFFVADGLLAHGELVGNGELDDLGWRAVGECQSLPMADVTRFMLERAVDMRARRERDSVIYYYVRGTPRVRREAALADRPRE